jgi:hypothetical protein
VNYFNKIVVSDGCLISFILLNKFTLYKRRRVSIKMAYINGVVFLIADETSRLLRDYSANGGYLISLSWSSE